MSRLSTRRNVIPVILALLLSGMLASAALATASYNTNCSSGRICNYENRDLVVPLAATLLRLFGNGVACQRTAHLLHQRTVAADMEDVPSDARGARWHVTRRGRSTQARLGR